MSRRKRAPGFTLVELMIVVTIIGLLAAIAIPNFIKMQVRARQSEAKLNLKSIFTAEWSYLSEHNAYTTTPDWGPDGSNRYHYQTNEPCTGTWARPGPRPAGGGVDCVTRDASRYPTGPVMAVNVTVAVVAAGVPTLSGPGVVGVCPNCAFLASAVANLDPDPAIDAWYITSHSGTAGGSFGCHAEPTVTAGQPTVYSDDLDCE